MSEEIMESSLAKLKGACSSSSITRFKQLPK